MSTLQSKILSMKETLNVSQVKPPEGVVEKYCKQLSENQEALDYLIVIRGLTKETIDNFKLGYDTKKNAISIPVFKRGEVVNIKYRLLNPDAKIRYMAEKDCEVWVFNEDGISKGRAKGGILITEGEFDCMSAWQAGFKNVVSSAFGKDGYGRWLELLDTIPKVYIAYDNDKPGKGASLKLAERVGTEKSFEILYPTGIKDANDYFKVNTSAGYRELIKNARPYYKYKYAGVRDVIDSIREKTENLLKIKCIPFIEFDDDWVAILSGLSNVGKTSYSLNIVDELVSKDIPVLVVPTEGGIKFVGKRYLQTRYNKTKNELASTNDAEWEKIIPDSTNLPLYFSMPTRDEFIETVIKAKRLFDTKVVILDHLNLMVRKSDPKNENIETANFIQNIKETSLEYGIIFIVLHHINKQNGLGSVPKKPRMEELKGASAIYQDPQAVIMLSQPSEGQIEVDIVKNKGEMGSKCYYFNASTGKLGEEVREEDKTIDQQFDDF